MRHPLGWKSARRASLERGKYRRIARVSCGDGGGSHGRHCRAERGRGRARSGGTRAHARAAARAPGAPHLPGARARIPDRGRRSARSSCTRARASRSRSRSSTSRFTPLSRASSSRSARGRPSRPNSCSCRCCSCCRSAWSRRWRRRHSSRRAARPLAPRHDRQDRHPARQRSPNVRAGARAGVRRRRSRPDARLAYLLWVRSRPSSPSNSSS